MTTQAEVDAVLLRAIDFYDSPEKWCQGASAFNVASCCLIGVCKTTLNGCTPIQANALNRLPGLPSRRCPEEVLELLFDALAET